MITPDVRAWLHGAVSVDLEVSRQNSRIDALGAVRGSSSGEGLTHKRGKGGDLRVALRDLDRFARGAAFLVGHNVMRHDLPHLEAADPRLELLRLPVLDTLALSPLAFPRNPYHRLVKHYKDGALRRGRLNDPELDARITLELLEEECAALARTDPELLLAWHGLLPADAAHEGFDQFFRQLRGAARPDEARTRAACLMLLRRWGACAGQAREAAGAAARHGWTLTYVLGWMSVAGGNSVLPPWVRHEFPSTAELVRQLRDTPCGERDCRWCRERHDACRELKRWMGFQTYRPEPSTEFGGSMQQAIVESSMRRRHVLGVLPTGSGKSLCYQIPALSRYHKTGALTVVISPLVALMADQVRGMERRGIGCCATLNGLLSMPERRDVLERVRLGDVGILLTSPEQLRNPSLRRSLEQRELGGWVLDEAHCLSQWGPDFRPDYRYVSRFISRHSPVPPILCLTATARRDVVCEIREHFQALGIEMRLYDGGAERENLHFQVRPSSLPTRNADLAELLRSALPEHGGAIVYCRTRKHTEELAELLSEQGFSADCFHAGLEPEQRKTVQERFIDGGLRVIVATNAFGMGIDKPDVRMVVHADMPGSMEHYVQEAGRAGRDRADADCVLLFAQEDAERQHKLSAYARLTRPEIGAVLRAMRRLRGKKPNASGAYRDASDAYRIEATSGEILLEEESAEFRRDSATDDTRVRTAVSWLEDAGLLRREENRVNVFPSSLRIHSIDEARRKIAARIEHEPYRGQLLALVDVLLSADVDEGISTDQLMDVSGLSGDGVRTAMFDLEALGIASNDTAISVYVHRGVARASDRRLARAAALEAALIRMLREQLPGRAPGDSHLHPLHLRTAAQRLREGGHAGVLPEHIRSILRGLARDGRDEDGKGGSIGLRDRDRETVQLTLKRDWEELERAAALRRDAAGVLLHHLYSRLPEKTRGVDLLVETTLGRLYASISDQLDLRARARDPRALADRALLWLHDLEIARLNRGMVVFRPAMTILLSRDRRRGFLSADFEPLKMHYGEQVAAIHVMAEYARLGLEDMRGALRLAADYFRLSRKAFIDRWFPGREKELGYQTSPESWRAICAPLDTEQRAVVADGRERANVLVLAGPGSGKTRVLVHRIAYLVRVRRERPEGIMALTYNRHAAVEIRRRLHALIGTDVYGLTILTCHALAMRLCGVSFARRAGIDHPGFDDVLKDAAALLRGEGLPPEEADAQRDRLLAGFRWICVDEYQDIDTLQYALISALAGRTLRDRDARLNLLAVGDDDQNIYAFAGASVEYIRAFTADYDARCRYLVENYRSTRHIIDAANRVIAPAPERQKEGHPIRIDRRRARQPPGGDWERIDPVGTGRVQLLRCGPRSVHQALAVMRELQRMQSLDPRWNWSRVAVIAREWSLLNPVRGYCVHHRIPVQTAGEAEFSPWGLRETQALLEHLDSGVQATVRPAALCGWIGERMLRQLRAARPVPAGAAALRDWLTRGAGSWWQLLRGAVREYAREYGAGPITGAAFKEWLAEWARDARRRQSGLLLLTAHRAKGLEFDHVAVLDGGWSANRDEDAAAERRLYYVAMTRARKTLALCRTDGRRHPILDGATGEACFLERERADPELPEELTPELRGALRRQYKTLSPACVYLSYAGMQDPTKKSGKRTHEALAALRVGDRLQLRNTSRRGEWFLCDTAGARIGRLARNKDSVREVRELYALLEDADVRCIGARVHAILARRRSDGEEAFRDRCRCERWEVVLPELVFAPRSADPVPDS